MVRDFRNQRKLTFSRDWWVDATVLEELPPAIPDLVRVFCQVIGVVEETGFLMVAAGAGVYFVEDHE